MWEERVLKPVKAQRTQLVSWVLKGEKVQEKEAQDRGPAGARERQTCPRTGGSPAVPQLPQLYEEKSQRWDWDCWGLHEGSLKYHLALGWKGFLLIPQVTKSSQMFLKGGDRIRDMLRNDSAGRIRIQKGWTLVPHLRNRQQESRHHDSFTFVCSVTSTYQYLEHVEWMHKSMDGQMDGWMDGCRGKEMKFWTYIVTVERKRKG